MNEHETIRKLLPLAVAGALESEELRRVEQHAHACGDCRRELEIWSRYAQAFRQLPQPSVPAGLLERTQSRILQQNAVASDHLKPIVLGAIAIFGWATGLVLWALVRGLTGGAVDILGLNLVSPLSWSLLSAVLTWITAAACALVLVRHREMRRTL
jgi:anti-sigma factor RsiW